MYSRIELDGNCNVDPLPSSLAVHPGYSGPTSGGAGGSSVVEARPGVEETSDAAECSSGTLACPLLLHPVVLAGLSSSSMAPLVARPGSRARVPQLDGHVQGLQGTLNRQNVLPAAVAA